MCGGRKEHCGALRPDGTCQFGNIKGNGRHIALKLQQIKGILSHFISQHPDIPIKSFCKAVGVSLTTYYKVGQLQYKAEKDINKVLVAAELLGYEYKDGGWHPLPTISTDESE